MLASVSGIIDGKRWLEDRLVALEAELNADLSDGERQAIESELTRVRQELSEHRRRFRRWLIWGGRPAGS
jgi:hypothetical protein